MHLGNLIWPFSESQVLYPPGTGEAGCVLLMELVDPRTNTLSCFVVVPKATELFFKHTGSFCVSPPPFQKRALLLCWYPAIFCLSYRQPATAKWYDRRDFVCIEFCVADSRDVKVKFGKKKCGFRYVFLLAVTCTWIDFSHNYVNNYI